MFNFTSLFLFLTIASFPLYLFDSGRPQISHVFFVLFVLAFSGHLLGPNARIQPKIKTIFKPLLLFVLVVCCVQITYSFILGNPMLLLVMAFYVFNIIYCLLIYLYLDAYKQNGLNVVFLAVLTAIGITLGGSITEAGGAYRQTSFFNNPNQLGYFALLASVVVLVFYTASSIKYAKLFALAALLINLYLATLSLSKAAMVATLICVVFFLPMFKRREIVILLLIGVASSPFWFDNVVQSTAFERAQKRIQRIGSDQDDSIFGRGYSRIAENPAYLFFGAGEGERERFGVESELHSTLGNIIFSYGLFGIGLFLLFHYQCFRYSPALFIVMFAPVTAYGITHNGIRFSYLWLMFALFTYFARMQKESGIRYVYVPKFISPQLSGQQVADPSRSHEQPYPSNQIKHQFRR